MVPGLVDGRNRVFWTFAYDAIRNTRIEPVLTTVPTEAMRNGDFSALLYRIFDPLTAVAEGNRRVRQPFPNNIIPQGRINSMARQYLDYYPLPNQPGRANGQDNYLSQMRRIDTFYSLMGRTDINLNDRNRLMFKFHMNDRVEEMGNLFGNLATGAATLSNPYPAGSARRSKTRSASTRTWGRLSPSRIPASPSRTAVAIRRACSISSGMGWSLR